MARSFKEDYIMGTQNEDKILDLLIKYFKDDIKKSDNKRSKYDYKGNEYYYELKTRTNEYNKYPTTLLGANKIFSDKHIFIFNFTDGLYYIKYDKLVFDSFEKKPFKRKQRIDISDKVMTYYFIPISNLIKIDI